MPLVRHYSAIFQDQLQAPYVGDVIERIVGDHNQVPDKVLRPVLATILVIVGVRMLRA
jgi:hypothetical protein